MSADHPKSLRQRIAARLPGPLRKMVRMGEHYARRLRAWREIGRVVEGVSPADRAVMRRSRLKSPLTACRHLDSYAHPVILDDAVVEVRDIGRFRIRARTDDILHLLPSRERHVVDLVRARLKPGGVFVDGGANIGFYSVLAANLVGESGSVLAVEMMPGTAAILRENVALNHLSQVELCETALAACDGEPVIARSGAEKLGQASIGGDPARGGDILEHAVTTATLDRLTAQYSRIDLLKLDLEGAEYDALLGAEDMLAKTAAIVFESNREDRRIIDLLGGAGFAIARLAVHDYLAERKPS